jgi:non-canonical purine NTP pyrophosphatase (RdgB/HAM1 family)
LVTGNQNKAIEFEKLIDIKELRFDSRSFDLIEIQSMSLEEVGFQKTATALEFLKGATEFDAVLTDDTGLFCDGLNGLPGPFIKLFLDTIGTRGLVDMVSDKSLKSKAVCLLTLGIVKTGAIIQFKGEVSGRLVNERGDSGFGWDTIFLPDGYDTTYGEMSLEEKNRISHRTLASKKLRDWVLKDLIMY